MPCLLLGIKRQLDLSIGKWRGVHMDFNDIFTGIKIGKYTNHKVLPLRKYKKSRYTDYNRDIKLFMEEQERVDSLFISDCRRAFENYIGQTLSLEQWKIVWSYIWRDSQGLTHFGIVNKLAELAPVLDSLIRYHNLNEEVNVNFRMVDSTQNC